MTQPGDRLYDAPPGREVVLEVIDTDAFLRALLRDKHFGSPEMTCSLHEGDERPRSRGAYRRRTKEKT